MLIDQWQQKRGDWEAVKEMFKQPRFVFVVSSSQQLLLSFYHWSLEELSRALKDYQWYHLELLENCDFIFNSFCAMTFFVGIVFVVQKVQNVMVKVYSSIIIMPVYLIKRNKVLIQRLQKIVKGEASDLV